MKKVLVLILTLALCMSCLPMAFAEEAADPTIEEGYTEAGDGFTSVGDHEPWTGVSCTDGGAGKVAPGRSCRWICGLCV